MNIKCEQCRITFRNRFTFQQHRCLVRYEDMTNHEMLRRYNSRKLPENKLDNKSK